MSRTPLLTLGEAIDFVKKSLKMLKYVKYSALFRLFFPSHSSTPKVTKDVQ
jgi:hypothetical protein